MKKPLWIVGIVVIIACVISLLIAAWYLYVYHHVLDGSPALYDRLHQRTIAFFAAGIILAVIGAVCMIVRSRL